MNPSFSAQFLSLFDDLETPFSTVIDLPQLLSAAKSDVGLVNRYLSHHISDLLEIVFNEDDGQRASMVMGILSSSIHDIYLHLLRKSNFSQRVTEFLSDQNTSQIIISRIAGIILTALVVEPSEATKQFIFIYQLLPRIDNTCVYNLFYTLLSSDERYLVAKIWLHMFGFADNLLNELEKIDYNYESHEEVVYYDKVFIVVSGLYTFISKATQADNLTDDFKTTRAVVVLKKTFSKRPPIFVLNARWLAIKSIICQKNANEMMDLLTEGINLLSEDSQRHFEYHVCIISFLASLIQFAPQSINILIDKKIPNLIINLILKFQTSTILHSEFRNFVDSCLKVEQISSTIISLYTPILIEEASKQENKIFIPTLFSILENFEECSKKKQNIQQQLSTIPNFHDFYESQVTEYVQKSNQKYGGRIQPNVSDLFSAYM